MVYSRYNYSIHGVYKPTNIMDLGKFHHDLTVTEPWNHG